MQLLAGKFDGAAVMAGKQEKPDNLGIVFVEYFTDREEISRDFDIFSLSMVMKPLCTQYLTNGFPVNASDCAISFSWWGKIRSAPPP